MKTILSISLFFSSAACAQQLPSKIEISQLNVRQGIVSGEMLAIGGKETRLWSDANQWGAARWRIIRIGRKGEVNVFYQNPYLFFTRNVPRYFVISAGGKKKFSLDINRDGWCDSSSCVQEGMPWKGGPRKFNKGDRLIIIYDAPASPEATRLRVWYGLASGSVLVSD